MIIAQVARSVYYYHLKLYQQPDTYQEIKAQITHIFDNHKGRYGYRRVHLELRQQGCHINHKKVQKLMQVLNLRSMVRPKRYKSYRGELGKVAPNQLRREFEATQPNEKWVTDVTEFNIKGEKVYLSPILDLYNREIISYEVSDKPQLSMVMTMLKKALKRLKGFDAPVLHSDQGWQYQMGLYQKVLKENGITQSMSRKGNCLDNAVMENWFGLMKTEYFYQKRFENVETFKEGLKEYIDYYNQKRIKQKLKGLSPVQYRLQSLNLAT